MIPLSEPCIQGNEWKYIKECLDTEWVSTAGDYVTRFEEAVANYTGTRFAVATVNGTSALQASLRLAGVESGDEVIVPTLTFIAPINAVAYNSAFPVFMDVDRYYNIDSKKTISFIENETIFKDGFTYNKTTGNKISAIIPVHVWGNACWLDDLVDICRTRNIVIVEDASESLGSFYTEGKNTGRHTGTIGELGCLSFNGNKIITTGGGGMILTDDENIAEKARYLTTQAKDDPVRYVHDEIGYNFRLTNIQAALGVAQMEQLSGFLNKKDGIYNKYLDGLRNIDGLDLASVPDYAGNNHWLNVLRIDSRVYGESQEALMNRLGENGIQVRLVWTLNHIQKPYRDCQSHQIEQAKELVGNSLCLPSSINLADDKIEFILELLNG
jgi:aminotransferase in exopolysaccharide biosynthesis